MGMMVWKMKQIIFMPNSSRAPCLRMCVSLLVTVPVRQSCL